MATAVLFASLPAPVRQHAVHASTTLSRFSPRDLIALARAVLQWPTGTSHPTPITPALPATTLAACRSALDAVRAVTLHAEQAPSTPRADLVATAQAYCYAAMRAARGTPRVASCLARAAESLPVRNAREVLDELLRALGAAVVAAAIAGGEYAEEEVEVEDEGVGPASPVKSATSTSARAASADRASVDSAVLSS
ncbi:hypothetical protein AMAG_10924 [Allomyces macrogynus ATCC 38327]|uniref:Uncharacterized protein n=1 Tax=Allomyces macrogynus (strain ATCC 38327) TaxID=578462 RepID=A0A0L0SS21_ALLM3|nr:hypothetical protein AMAG_10924 [Allomyces macrogynus ATCC 38327]|eukprot:KNE65281.1 hypothetical protein AMAG_10924 [Allomyces macrogynus ATCC 38327]